MQLNEQTVATLRSIVDSAVEGTEADIPGATVVVFGKDDSKPFVHSAGRRGVSYKESSAMTPENVFWIASCTKMVTGLACMQLVEKGHLKLDDSAHLEALCPELRDVKVLNQSGDLEEKKSGITLRMLLTHTAGFGYSFFNERLRDFSYPAGFDECSGYVEDVLQPLLHQPGEAWEYGISIDWAGIAVERATGVRLNDYFHENVFQPLGLENISMVPTHTMKEKLAQLHFRRSDGKLKPRDHLMRRPLAVRTTEAGASLHHSGGAGLFAKPEEYCHILAVLLNDGVCPRTGTKLLERATVDDMFANHIPQFPNFARQGIPAAKPELTKPIPDLYPAPDNTPQGWGLSFMLSGGATGRSEGTGWWAGLANLYWWADREKGVGGLVCTQIFPFADPKVMWMWAQLEATVYAGLGEA